MIKVNLQPLPSGLPSGSVVKNLLAVHEPKVQFLEALDSREYDYCWIGN